MSRNVVLAAVLLIAAPPTLFAQRGGMTAGMGGARTAFGAGFGIPQTGAIGRGRPGNGFTTGFGHHHRNRFFNPAGFFWGDGFLDGGYWDDQPVVVNEPPTPVVVETESHATEKTEPSKPSEPVMIEWQGNRFVRLNDAEANASAEFASVATDYHEQSPREAKSQRKQSAAAASRQEQQPFSPTVLVFRDGHRAEVDSYAIIGRTLYESSTDQTSGYRNQKIELADLNVPETVKANQERGVRFVLPSAPNEVVTRP